jgi:glucose-6-phosphate isomerase
LLERALGAEEAAQRFLLVTEPADNPMRRFGEARGMRILDHDPGIGGRYSVLSLVGLLPAVLAGRDPEAVRAGAATVLRRFLDAAKTEDIPPAVGAALSLAMTEERDVWVSVMCPYADALAPFAQWYAQLWAESLGKEEWGSTPYPARGTVDQHSQLQLWLGGPRDKLVTILTASREGTGAALPAEVEDKELAYLAGRTIGDVMAAEQRATIDTLAQGGIPVRHVALEALDERTLGALFMHFMLETILAGTMLGFDPFDQPAVEDGKKRARKYLSEMRRD